MELVAEASNGREAIEQFRIHKPDVILMDLQMPEMNGVDAIIAICGEFPRARIIVLTTYTGDVQVLRALRAVPAGTAQNLLRKELLETIRLVHAGQKRIPPDVASESPSMLRMMSVEREIEVLRLISGGNANKEIGAQLSITEETVKGQSRISFRNSAPTIGHKLSP